MASVKHPNDIRKCIIQIKMIELLPIDVIKVMLEFLPFETWLSVFLTSKLMYRTAKKAFDPSADNNR